MGKWIISKPYLKNLDNIQTLPNYLLLIKNCVLPIIFGSSMIGYLLSNGYGHPYLCMDCEVVSKAKVANKNDMVF